MKIIILMIVIVLVLASCGQRNGIGSRPADWIPPEAVIVEDLGKNHGYSWVVFELRDQLFLYGSCGYDSDPAMSRIETWENE